MLTEALVKFSEKTKKVVVLTGCHSGQFIREKDIGIKKTLLTGVPNITVLSSARWDASAWGLESNPEAFFPEILGELLEPSSAKPDAVDWRRIHSAIVEKVNDKERMFQINDKERSNPQFFRNLQ